MGGQHFLNSFKTSFLAGLMQFFKGHWSSLYLRSTNGNHEAHEADLSCWLRAKTHML